MQIYKLQVQWMFVSQGSFLTFCDVLTVHQSDSLRKENCSGASEAGWTSWAGRGSTSWGWGFERVQLQVVLTTPEGQLFSLTSICRLVTIQSRLMVCSVGLIKTDATCFLQNVNEPPVFIIARLSVDLSISVTQLLQSLLQTSSCSSSGLSS